MPMHDWTRVIAGTYHDFHNTWIINIKNTLNDGRLPTALYAMSEQRTGENEIDVLTLESGPSNGEWHEDDTPNAEGGVAVAIAKPKTRFSFQADVDWYARKRNTVVIRHASDDRVIAMIEIMSPGNKSSRVQMDAFVDKAVGAISNGVHLLVVDPFPPSTRDPEGIHGVIWSKIWDDSYVQPTDKPQTLASYCSGFPIDAYVEPIAVGDTMPPMPLFLNTKRFIDVPLEETYSAAWGTFPERWKRIVSPS